MPRRRDSRRTPSCALTRGTPWHQQVRPAAAVLGVAVTLAGRRARRSRRSCLTVARRVRRPELAGEHAHEAPQGRPPTTPAPSRPPQTAAGKHGRRAAAAAATAAAAAARRARTAGSRSASCSWPARPSSTAQLNEALLQQGASGKRVGTLLVELGAIDERDLAEALAEQLSPRAGRPRRRDPRPRRRRAACRRAIARAHQCIPMMRTDGRRSSSPSPTRSERSLQQLQPARPSCDVTLVVAPASDIRHAIDTSYRSLEGIDQFVKAFEKTIDRQARPSPLTSESTQDDAPVVQVVNKIITQALRDRASDVHIEPQDARLRIRFRIDGALHDVLALPEAMGPALVSRLKIMAGMNIVERRRPQDGQIAMDVDGRAVDIRVATHRRHLGREGRAPHPRQEPPALQARRPRHAGGHARDVLASWCARRSAWCSAPARPAPARPRRSTRR